MGKIATEEYANYLAYGPDVEGQLDEPTKCVTAYRAVELGCGVFYSKGGEWLVPIDNLYRPASDKVSIQIDILDVDSDQYKYAAVQLDRTDTVETQIQWGQLAEDILPDESNYKVVNFNDEDVTILSNPVTIRGNYAPQLSLVMGINFSTYGQVYGDNGTSEYWMGSGTVLIRVYGTDEFSMADDIDPILLAGNPGSYGYATIYNTDSALTGFYVTDTFDIGEYVEIACPMKDKYDNVSFMCFRIQRLSTNLEE